VLQSVHWRVRFLRSLLASEFPKLGQVKWNIVILMWGRNSTILSRFMHLQIAWRLRAANRPGRRLLRSKEIRWLLLWVELWEDLILVANSPRSKGLIYTLRTLIWIREAVLRFSSNFIIFIDSDSQITFFVFNSVNSSSIWYGLCNHWTISWARILISGAGSAILTSWLLLLHRITSLLALQASWLQVLLVLELS